MQESIVTINELTGEQILDLVKTACDIKGSPGRYAGRLNGRTLLLLFQKTSTRTRLAFELGMKKLGGNTIVMDWGKSNFSISPLRYEARYVGSMVDVILARLLRNSDVVELARTATVPVINGCCDMYHPSQALADLMTVYEKKGGFDTTLAYVGVHNNVANSLFYACGKVGLKLIFVTPLRDRVPEDFHALAEGSETFEETLDLEYAASKSEFIYTDTWVNMEEFRKVGERQDPETENKIKRMRAYQINRDLVKDAKLFVMHDMPVHPGMEIDDYAINCGNSLIFTQAENRMHTGQALLLRLLQAGG